MIIKIMLDKIETKSSLQIDSQLLKEYSKLTAHFQPIFSSKDGRIFAYEALARHEDDRVKIIDLIYEAKKNGSIHILDMFCRRNAIKCAKEQFDDEFLFINICPETIFQNTHEKGITDRIVEEFNFPKDRIVLEITENFLANDYTPLLKTICYYKEAGYKIAIDDFGAGFGGPKLLSISCSEYLKPDFVKIDKHFINTIKFNHFSYSFVEFVMRICHDTNISVIAEGIENYEQLSECVKLGIDYLQGFFLGKPQKSITEFQLYYACK